MLLHSSIIRSSKSARWRRISSDSIKLIAPLSTSTTTTTSSSYHHHGHQQLQLQTGMVMMMPPPPRCIGIGNNSRSFCSSSFIDWCGGGGGGGGGVNSSSLMTKKSLLPFRIHSHHYHGGVVRFQQSHHHHHHHHNYHEKNRLPQHRQLFSSLSKSSNNSSNNTRIFHYGNNNDTTTNTKEEDGRIRFSKLTPRQSAELEDELFARLSNNNNNNDNRLMDPILKKVISRKGLDWIRSVSVPSSSSSTLFGSSDNDDNDNDDAASDFDCNDKDSIIVTIQPPTLLHPKLSEIASNVADIVQEEIVQSLIRNERRSEWFTTTTTTTTTTMTTTTLASDGGSSVDENDKQRIGVTIKISPRSSSTTATTTHNNNQSILHQKSKALQNITHFVAVYSCKGGVGKSTIATNLAYQLANSYPGSRIGLVDLDVYGPSLPLLVHPDDPTVRQTPPSSGVHAGGGGEGNDETSASSSAASGMIEPIHHRNVSLMSLGYVSPTSGVPGSGPNSGAAVLRGPMAGRVVSQLLHNTNWGPLDILLLDLPPGTGDVQLEVCQSLSLSGAVAVSTPSSLAWADVRKGVQMFGELGVGTLGLVENMAYFVCEGGGRHYPFGRTRMMMGGGVDGDDGASGDSIDGGGGGGGDSSTSSSSSLADHFLPSPSHVFHLPISTTVNESNDSGTPLCCDIPNNNNDNNNNRRSGAEEELATFSKLADAISTDLLLIQHGKTPLSMQGKDSVSGKNGGGSNSVLAVTVDGAGDSEFDVPFTQLSVDNDHKNFTVRLFSNEGGYQKVISGGDLRVRDPRTGEEDLSAGEQKSQGAPTHGGCGSVGGSGASQKMSSMVQHHTANDDIDSQQLEEKDGLFPAKITKKGNYGYEVEWADGAKIIYSLLAIAKAAGGKPAESKG